MVVLFVFVFIDIALVAVGSKLLSLFFGFLSITIDWLALVNYGADIPFHPYLEIMCGLTGAITMLIAGARFKGWV